MPEKQSKNNTRDARNRLREVNRLNRLEKTLWPAVAVGDADAMKKVLDIIDRRCRLLDLYAPRNVTFTDITGIVVRKFPTAHAAQSLPHAQVPFNRKRNGSDAD